MNDSNNNLQNEEQKNNNKGVTTEKNNPLNLNYKELIWKKYLEESEEELKNLNFGLYRNTRLTMSEFLRDKNRDKERLYYLCEVAAYDISGLGNSYYPDFEVMPYVIESHLENMFPYREHSSIVIAPYVVNELEHLQEKMKLEGVNFEEEVIKNLTEIKVYKSVFTTEEQIEIVFAELDEDFEKLEKIYSIAEKRIREYCDELKNDIIEEEFIDENNEVYEKDQAEAKWTLESNNNTFFNFNKKIIEDEINKINTMESEWLVLEPPESIKGTIYLQVCIEVPEGDYRRDGENFHIEVCFEDDEEKLTSFRKDNVTKEEVLRIFIDYFENNNIPDIKDWYSIEL